MLKQVQQDGGMSINANSNLARAGGSFDFAADHFPTDARVPEHSETQKPAASIRTAAGDGTPPQKLVSRLPMRYAGVNHCFVEIVSKCMTSALFICGNVKIFTMLPRVRCG
jgi:hypothetical protein